MKLGGGTEFAGHEMKENVEIKGVVQDIELTAQVETNARIEVPHCSNCC